MQPIRIAIAGVGNCASSLIQGVAYYTAHSDTTVGLMRPRIGPYRVADMEAVAAFDVDARKVGQPLSEAIFAPPNNTKIFFRPPESRDVIVQMGQVLDGIAAHMADYPPERRFIASDAKPCEVSKVLRDSGAEILINYLPVGSYQATEYYAEACLAAGVSLVNCIPIFIVSNPSWAKRFAERGIPCVGDDIKAQVGATITHRTLAKLFNDRGVRIDSTYQLNTGGNTDFMNMLNHERLRDKKISKTEAVQSQLGVPLDPDRIHIGPSDYVPFLLDNKVCFLRIEGSGFAGVPMHLELRLSVEDSPNSAAVVVDAIRYCKLARDAKLAGPIESASAWCMKHPPRQMTDPQAMQAVDQFIAQSSAGVKKTSD